MKSDDHSRILYDDRLVNFTTEKIL